MLPDIWKAPGSPGSLDAKIVLPGSKSLTARALFLAAMSEAPLTISHPLAARDTILACRALEQMGVSFSSSGPHTLTAMAPKRPQGGAIDCGLAGTVMRFGAALAAFGSAPVSFDGDPAARERPMRPLLDALKQLGAQVQYHGAPGYLPFTITGLAGTDLPKRITLDSSESSQYLSAMLLASCLAPRPFTIELESPPPSAAHVEMTIANLTEQGVHVGHPSETEFVVGGARPSGAPITIEPDLSNAGPFVAATLICAGTIRIPGWPTATQQAGDEWQNLVPRFGGTVRRIPGAIEISATEGHRWPGGIFDLSRVGELAPTVAALAALANSPSELRGIAHLRGHETDRLEALATELRRCGAGAEILPDGLRITPGPLRPARFKSYNDHRLATFGAILGLALPGSEVVDIATTSKTLPDFCQRWTAMLEGEKSPPVPALEAALGLTEMAQ